MKAVISQKNKDEVKNLTELINKYPIVGIVDLTGVPSAQLQNMRDNLRENVVIRTSKKTLIKISLEKSEKEGLNKLKSYVKGMPALILTNESPFKLANILKKSKTKVAAKAGQTAPNDIKVAAGPTSFSPGPIIGELGSAGIKAGIEGGKVVIKEDSVVVREGEMINQNVAGLLSRLKIEPMEIGLNLTGVFEEGIIYEKKILEVDEQEYIDKIKKAARESFNLALNIAYTTKDNIMLMLTKAHIEAAALANELNVPTKENIKHMLAKGESHAKSLNI